MDKFPAVIREEIELLLDLERCRLEREELVTYLKEIEKRDSFIMHTIGVVNETRQRRKATVNL